MNEYVDTHCHLQKLQSIETISECIDNAAAVGVRSMLCCGTCEDDWVTVLNLARHYSSVIPALGLHPWYCSTRKKKWLSTLNNLLQQNPCCAVGEIGLDHAMKIRDDKDQHEVFTLQLSLAQQLHRTVSIHCIDAWGNLMKLLRSEYCAPLPKMIIHAYNGPVELIPELESYGISLSVSGSVINERYKRVRNAVNAISDNALLLETDRIDGVSSLLPEIAATVASLRECTVEKISHITTANAYRIFQEIH